MHNKTDFSLIHPIRVRWAECDAQGIVFNVNYFLYFDVAMIKKRRRQVGDIERCACGFTREGSGGNRGI